VNDRSTLPLPERLEVEAAIDAAFAPLRARRTDLSPLRVRAAVRWGRGRDAAPPAALAWSGAVRRLSELSMAVGMSVLMFGAALGPALPESFPPVQAESASARASGPTVEVQREILVTKQEWFDTIRARFGTWTAPLQDLLDPNVVRQVIRVRTDLPAPLSENAGLSEPY
jgi:hypothetical protein